VIILTLEWGLVCHLLGKFKEAQDYVDRATKLKEDYPIEQQTDEL
jgi:hypothetical protein